MWKYDELEDELGVIEMLRIFYIHLCYLYAPMWRIFQCMPFNFVRFHEKWVNFHGKCTNFHEKCHKLPWPVYHPHSTGLRPDFVPHQFRPICIDGGRFWRRFNAAKNLHPSTRIKPHINVYTNESGSVLAP